MTTSISLRNYDAQVCIIITEPLRCGSVSGAQRIHFAFAQRIFAAGEISLSDANCTFLFFIRCTSVHHNYGASSMWLGERSSTNDCCGAQNLLLARARQILTAATPYASLHLPQAALGNVPLRIRVANLRRRRNNSPYEIIHVHAKRSYISATLYIIARTRKKCKTFLKFFCALIKIALRISDEAE